jgi:hypothetical protein
MALSLYLRLLAARSGPDLVACNSADQVEIERPHARNDRDEPRCGVRSRQLVNGLSNVTPLADVWRLMIE